MEEEKKFLNKEDMDYLQAKLDELKKNPSAYKGVFLSASKAGESYIDSRRVMSDRTFAEILISESAQFLHETDGDLMFFMNAIAGCLEQIREEEDPERYAKAKKAAENVVKAIGEAVKELKEVDEKRKKPEAQA